MEPEAEEGMPHQQSPSPSPPQTAKPVIASTILENLLRQRYRHERIREKQRGSGAAVAVSGFGHGGRRDREAAAAAAAAGASRVRSGFKELDDYVLMGGMERGTVVGISGDGEGGGIGRLVSLHFLISALLFNPLAKASIIDTRGSFSVPLLAQIIRLRASSQFTQARHASKGDTERVLDGIVQDVLGRVAISRAFDIEGVWEVLSEISANCRSDSSASGALDLDEEEIESLMSAPKPATPKEMSNRPGPVGREDKQELEIDDSEAEDDESDLEEQLELEEYQSSKLDLEQRDANDLSSRGLHPPSIEPTADLKPPESNGRTEIILIDNMTSPINELFSRRERSFAHTLLTTFSRTLYNLSQSHSILTILLNTLTQPSDHKKFSTSRSHTKPISVFAATTARPALGRLFSDLCALHILINLVAKTANDAQALHVSPPIESSPSNSDEAGDEQSASPQHQHQHQPLPMKAEIQCAHVIEVIKDTVHDLDSYHLNSDLHPFRNPHDQQQQDFTISTSTRPNRNRKRSRCQRWAPFTVSADGLELQNAFGHRAEPAVPVHVMHLVKQFPFGRRI